MKANNNLLVNQKNFSYLKYFRILGVFRTPMKDVESKELWILVSRVIEVYNRYRSPEGTAALLEFEKTCFTIEFEGTFCDSCGVQDYLDYFLYERARIVDNN